MSLRVGFASCDWSPNLNNADGTRVMGGAGWARLGQYVDHLPEVKSLGVLLFDKNRRRFGVRDWHGNDNFDLDIIVMQRVMFSDVPDRIEIAKKSGQFIINDLDDWYWGLSSENQAFNASHPKLNPSENTNHYKNVLARSDMVTVSTPYLAERIEKWNKHIEVLPNTVDLKRFSVHDDQSGDCPLVGWVGSTAHRSGDLKELRGFFDSMISSGQIRIHHSGYNPAHPSFADELNIPAKSITVLPMASPADYPKLFIFDVGLVPLTNVPFNKAKSAIKGLEYAACGIPFIASPCDSYLELHGDGIGLIAKKRKNWPLLVQTLRDESARKEIGMSNRAKVSKYDISVGIERWRKLFDSIR